MRLKLKSLLLLLAVTLTAPTVSCGQTWGIDREFTTRPLTPVERLRLGDTLQVRWDLRQVVREQRAATDSCNLRLTGKDEQLRSLTGKYTVAQSKAGKRGAENWLWRSAAFLLGVFAVTR
jgi:hypothetical protein